MAQLPQSAGTFTLVTPGTYLVTAVLNPPPGSALANADAVLRSQRHGHLFHADAH
ncbi:MAG: hypothetical protein ACLUHE_01455 [Christensenellales bacterium]